MNLVGHPLCCSFVGQTSGDTVFAAVSSTTHLYRRFEEDEISFSGDADKIHSLQWLPVFVTGKVSKVTNTKCYSLIFIIVLFVCLFVQCSAVHIH